MTSQERNEIFEKGRNDAQNLSMQLIMKEPGEWIEKIAFRIIDLKDEEIRPYTNGFAQGLSRINKIMQKG